MKSLHLIFAASRVFSRRLFCRLRICWVGWNNGGKTPGDDARADELIE